MIKTKGQSHQPQPKTICQNLSMIWPKEPVRLNIENRLKKAIAKMTTEKISRFVSGERFNSGRLILYFFLRDITI